VSSISRPLVADLLLTYDGTSSNGGVFGSLFGTPIINLPQSAVLGKCHLDPKSFLLVSRELGVMIDESAC
jgi:hypothetical protein